MDNIESILKLKKVFNNLSYDEILDHELINKEGVVCNNNAFCCDTGVFTGRSPKDKYFVQQEPSKNNIWWGNINKPCSIETFNILNTIVLNHYQTTDKPIYVFNGFCGASIKNRIHVRIISEIAWQHHFVTNMFIRPNDTELEKLKKSVPDFTIINACRTSYTDYKKSGLNSECFVALNIEDKVGLIGGTWYGGEMKKGIFSMMNYWLPLQNIMSMHCSANIGKDGDTALFFGLSGTGKTTLSADPNRFLIGDDEHGWDDDGIFNLEGGCYAKTIRLSQEKEPDIYNAIKKNALLENIVLVNTVPDYNDSSKTENGRVSYPLEHIVNRKLDSCDLGTPVPNPTDVASLGSHPKKIIFLTCDAYGVLGPISLLSKGQAMYHFLSGYTAKIAGTERGVLKPTAAFSACFGEAFMPLHPTQYADVLSKKIDKYGSQVYLVNTGWSGGSYGIGKRIDISVTRKCIDAILNGDADIAPFIIDPIFKIKTITQIKDIDCNVLNPRKTWENKIEYDNAAKNLANLFIKNYAKYQQPNMTDYSKYGPK
jgi:phosphoenolpyruvate carboxykinase (ATP)